MMRTTKQASGVVNDLGDRWKDFGDSNLHKPDPDNRTAEMAELAVKLGVDDIQHAFNLGKSHPGPVANEFIFDSVKLQASSPAVAGVKYGPEQIIPRVDEAAGNGAQTWQAASFDALWGTAVRSDSSTTYGSAISASLQSGDIRETLDGMAEKFPDDQKVYTVDGPSDNPWVRPEIKNSSKVMQEASSIGTLHPRKAFLNGFLQPLLDNPQVGLRSIIDFNPSEGQAFFNEDDAVMAEAGKMGDDEFKGFTRQPASRPGSVAGRRHVELRWPRRGRNGDQVVSDRGAWRTRRALPVGRGSGVDGPLDRGRLDRRRRDSTTASTATSLGDSRN